MKMRKRRISFLLALLLFMSLLPAGRALAEDAEASTMSDPSPEDGEGLTWSDLGLEPVPSGDETEGRITPVSGDDAGTIAPLAENDAQTRQVYGGCSVMDENGGRSYSDEGGSVIPSSQQPRVGETLSFAVHCNSGYRLQWLTVSRDSELVGTDVTETLSFYVGAGEGDVYYMACFTREGTTPLLKNVMLDVQMPVPGGSYSGLVPADAAPVSSYASAFRVLSARWYLLTDGHPSDPESFEPGLDYSVEITVAPNAGWRFSGDSQVFLYLSNGEYLHGDGDVYVSYCEDGSLIMSSRPITLPASEPGDIDGDGSIGPLDLLLLRKYLVGLEISGRFDPGAADMNGDGGIDIRDLVRLRKLLA